MNVSMEGLKIFIKHEVNIPVRTLVTLDVEVDIQRKNLDQLYDIQPHYLLTNQYPNLVITPMIHRISVSEPLLTQALIPVNSKIPADKNSQIH